MSELLNTCWTLLAELYQAIRGGGYTGCGIAFVVTFILLKWGIRITGRNATITIWPSRDGITPGAVVEKPAVSGTAKNWFEGLIGRLMVIAGMILMVVTVCAAFNVALFELTRPR